MVFADVSGFTRLSERLARKGKEGERLARRGGEGSEQLVDVINACFSALLAEAYGGGGSLVKFGGDAMVLVFYEGGQPGARDARVLLGDGDAAPATRSGPGSRRRRATSCCGCRSACTAARTRCSSSADPIASCSSAAGDDHARRAGGAASAGQILVSPETAAAAARAAPWARASDRASCSAARPAPCEWVPPARAARPTEAVDESLPPGRGPGASAQRIGGARASHRGDRLSPFRRARRS